MPITVALVDDQQLVRAGFRMVVASQEDMEVVAEAGNGDEATRVLSDVVAAIKAGASGFLLKDAPPEDLLHAIRTVDAGEAVIAPTSTRRLLTRLVTALPEAIDASAFSSLTEREREVLVLMARGLSNQEICTELFLAEPTVKTHVGHVLAKLSARDRVQAVVMAYEAGLVRPQG